MRTVAKVENVNDVEITMSFTMTVKEWIEFNNQLRRDWPSWRISGSVNRVISRIQRDVIDMTEEENS